MPALLQEFRLRRRWLARFPSRAIGMLGMLQRFHTQTSTQPTNHRLAFFVPDLGGSDLLQSCLFEPWHEDFKAFGGLSQVKLHITLVWEGFDREVDQCGLCLVHRLSSFSVLTLEEFAVLNQL